MGTFQTMIHGQQCAREIMGKNFLGIEEVVKHFKTTLNPQQLDALATIPFADATLDARRDAYLLVAWTSMTIPEILRKAPNEFRTAYSHTYLPWQKDQTHAPGQRLDPRWCLIRKEIIAGSRSKRFVEQKILLPANEAVPQARELAYTIMLYLLATGEQLFSDVLTRCIGPNPDDGLVTIGGGGLFNLTVADDMDAAFDNVGLASCVPLDAL